MKKGAGLMGRMFDVVISSTGKHYLIGEVVCDSLPLIPPCPAPLPYGAVSGIRPPSRTGPVRAGKETGWLPSSDSLLLLLAFIVVLVAVALLCCRITAL